MDQANHPAVGIFRCITVCRQRVSCTLVSQSMFQRIRPVNVDQSAAPVYPEGQYTDIDFLPIGQYESNELVS